jgi:hypothetical protein
MTLGDEIGSAIWKFERKVGNLFGINPVTMPVVRDAEKAKTGIMQREKKAGIARNFGTAYDTDEWKKKHGGRRKAKTGNGKKKIQPTKPPKRKANGNKKIKKRVK